MSFIVWMLGWLAIFWSVTEAIGLSVKRHRDDD